MQITVSSAMAKRIDETSSSSPRARLVEGAAEGGIGSEAAAVILRAKNKAGPLARHPPWLVPDCAAWFNRALDSAQAGDVIRHRADLAVIQLRGDLRHLRAVLADAVAEG